jgi:hypothetical protein
LIILKVTQRGHLVDIPGLSRFRTPAEINISNCSIDLVRACLKNQGIETYEIFTKDDPKIVKDEKKNLKKNVSIDIEKRLSKIEKLIESLNKKDSEKNIPEEQIKNKLLILEELSKKILERENIREIVYTSTKEPIVEDLDEEVFIPEIDISDLEMKGSSGETIATRDDVDEAVNALSQLKRREVN